MALNNDGGLGQPIIGCCDGFGVLQTNHPADHRIVDPMSLFFRHLGYGFLRYLGYGFLRRRLGYGFLRRRLVPSGGRCLNDVVNWTISAFGSLILPGFCPALGRAFSKWNSWSSITGISLPINC